MTYNINIPEEIDKIEKLKVKDKVNLSGIIYTARDIAHERIVNSIIKGEEPPIKIKNQVIFYAGPAPKKEEEDSAAIGPTTSYRMDKFTPFLLRHGLKIMIGKGKRNNEVIKSIEKNKAVYLIAIGGIAAYLFSKIKHMEVEAYKDLGPEAIYKLKVEDFPCIVAVDSKGNSIY